jgi:hypothetical protein
VSESFDNVVHEYISFINEQVGMYMEALAGFAGHYTRIERQIQRVLRPVRVAKNKEGESVVVSARYEDPRKPDVIIYSTVRAVDYIATNAPGGSNEQKLARAIVVFLFTYWEGEIRPRLARAKGVEIREIRSDIMGDIRVLRNVILHSKSVLRAEKQKELKKLRGMFAIDQPLHLSYEDMQQIFILIKQDCGRLMFEWRGVKDSPIAPGEIRDIAIQKGASDKEQS